MTWSSHELVNQRAVDTRALSFRTWRRSIRLTQKVAAELLGIHSSSLTHIEIGTHRLTDEVAEKLAELQSGWDESMRPSRPPETRGGWRGGRKDRRSLVAANDSPAPPL